MSEITPFEINISDDEIADLKQRLASTRWANKETVDDWEQGIPLSYVQEVCEYWQSEYDWKEREALLNRFPQFKTNIDGLDIHFIHVRSPEENATPLVMTHGWPGSIVEFQKVIEPLTNPTALGVPPRVSLAPRLRLLRQADPHGLGRWQDRGRLARAPRRGTCAWFPHSTPRII